MGDDLAAAHNFVSACNQALEPYASEEHVSLCALKLRAKLKRLRDQAKHIHARAIMRGIDITLSHIDALYDGHSSLQSQIYRVEKINASIKEIQDLTKTYAAGLSDLSHKTTDTTLEPATQATQNSNDIDYNMNAYVPAADIEAYFQVRDIFVDCLGYSYGSGYSEALYTLAGYEALSQEHLDIGCVLLSDLGRSIERWTAIEGTAFDLDVCLSAHVAHIWCSRSQYADIEMHLKTILLSLFAADEPPSHIALNIKCIENIGEITFQIDTPIRKLASNDATKLWLREHRAFLRCHSDRVQTDICIPNINFETKFTKNTNLVSKFGENEKVMA